MLRPVRDRKLCAFRQGGLDQYLNQPWAAGRHGRGELIGEALQRTGATGFHTHSLSQSDKVDLGIVQIEH